MTTSSPNSDPYLWVGPSSGSWGDRANWQDQTTGTTGSVPRATNAVTFGVDTPALVALANDTVTGTGRSASLGLYGNLTLSGTFKTGALNLYLSYEPPGNYLTSSLTVSGAGNSLQARSAVAAGNLAVSDGAAVSVARTYEIASGAPTPNPARYELYGISVDGAGSRVTIGGLLSTDNASDLLVSNGGYLEARRMTLTNTYGIGAYAADGQSTIEVGTLGNAAAGTWTIDPGRILTADNRVQLSAPEFVINGVIDDVGGLDLKGSPGNVTGSGRIRLEASALLTIGQSGDQLSVVFRGDGAELDLADGAAAFSSTIRGFAAGDSIAVTGPTFTAVAWQRGVLDLFNGTTIVGALTMAGRYKGDMFSVANNVITLDAPSGGSSAAPDRKEAGATERSLHLFVQAVAGLERHGSASSGFSAAEADHSNHPLLAAAR